MVGFFFQVDTHHRPILEILHGYQLHFGASIDSFEVIISFLVDVPTLFGEDHDVWDKMLLDFGEIASLYFVDIAIVQHFFPQFCDALEIQHVLLDALQHIFSPEQVHSRNIL